MTILTAWIAGIVGATIILDGDFESVLGGLLKGIKFVAEMVIRA